MWGNYPSRRERKQKFFDALKEAYNKKEDKFAFYVETAYICEATFRRCLGLTEQSSAWKSAKGLVRSGGDITDRLPPRKADSYTSKIDYMRRWIMNFAASSCERAPINDHLDDILYVLPFMNVTDFAREFLHEHPGFGSKSTFIRAHGRCPNIRFMRCKGSMPTCGICDSIAQLLSNTKFKHKLSPLEKEIVLSFRRRHIHRQSKERDTVEERKHRARQVDLQTGEASCFYAGADGFTEARTEVPQRGKSKGGTKGNVREIGKITNRCIGVEVICGSLETTFLYFLDDFTRGGANMMVEVMRRTISDLRDLLATKGMSLPRTAYLSFDNCGENKNRFKFAYYALLVELQLLDHVEVYFLVVGHTHSPLDQYFSVLSAKIGSTFFKGSPMAMRHLLAVAHSDKSARPAVVKLIPVLYDVSGGWEGHLCHIKYHQVPHCFKFSRLTSGKAYMQYKLFSPEEDSYYWLPVLPQEEEFFQTPLDVIFCPDCPSVGGWDSFIDDNINIKHQTVAAGLRQTLTDFECNAQSQFERKDIFGEEMEEPIQKKETEAIRGGEIGVIQLLKSDAATISLSTPLIDPRLSTNAIAHVAKVARQVVAAVTDKHIKLTQKEEFSFYAHRLTTGEYDWWKSINTTEKVKEMLRLRVEEAGPWTPLYPMSSELQSKMDDPRTKARVQASIQRYNEAYERYTQNFKKLLERKADGLSSDLGVIHATGLTNDPSIRRSTSRAANLSPIQLTAIMGSRMRLFKKMILQQYLTHRKEATSGTKDVMILRILEIGGVYQDIVQFVESQQSQRNDAPVQPVGDILEQPNGELNQESPVPEQHRCDAVVDQVRCLAEEYDECRKCQPFKGYCDKHIQNHICVREVVSEHSVREVVSETEVVSERSSKRRRLSSVPIGLIVCECGCGQTRDASCMTRCRGCQHKWVLLSTQNCEGTWKCIDCQRD